MSRPLGAIGAGAFCAAVLGLAGASRGVESDGPQEPPGNAPRILLAAEINAEGNLNLVRYKTIYIGFDGYSYNERSLYEVPLDGVEIRDVEGREISLEKARRRLAGARDTAILVMSRSERLAAVYKSLLRDDGLVFTFRREAPVWQQIQEPGRPVR